MPRTKDFQRLVLELAKLGPSERARVMADAAQHGRPRSVMVSMPVLEGGSEWVGGDLRREELYGADGR